MTGNGPRRRGRPSHPDVLTPAEWRTVHAVRHGMTNRQIAERRGISVDAVKFHVANAVSKLGLPNRAAIRTWTGVPVDSALWRASPDRGGQVETDESLRLGAIGQIARHVSDVGKAVAWYRDVLRLPHLYTFGDLAFFDCGGTRLFLSAPENGGVPGPQSILYFRVDDISAAHQELQSRGVTFTHAPHLIFTHPSGMEEWMAFFTDPDGQPLAIMSRVGG